MNKLFKMTLALTLGLGLVSLPSLSEAATAEKIASTANIQRDAIIVRIATGEVQKKSGSGEWLPLPIGADLEDSDMIKTGKNSTVLLELPENVGYVRLLPETEIRVDKIKVDKGFEGGQIAELSLSKGKVITKIRKFNRKSSKLQINTKGATAAVRGTSFLTSFNELDETKVTVGDGKVAVKSSSEEVLVNPKEFTKVAFGGQPSTPDIVESKLDFSVSNLNAENNKLLVSGITDPEAQINLNKNALFANNDGSFKGNLTLKEGQNNIVIKASTIDGRTKLSNLKVIKFTE